MSHARTFPFHLVGQLEGYTLGKSGKIHRLLIQTNQGEYSIKLSHASRIELLRSILNNLLQQGSWLEVTGFQKIGSNGLLKSLKAERVMPAAFDKTVLMQPLAVSVDISPRVQDVTTKILVCQKSDCCKRGSAKLQRAIETAVCDRSLGNQVCVKAVGCLKHCSKGPNIVIGKKAYRDVAIGDIEHLLDRHFSPSRESIPAA
jgi:NADH:ubiquinone oxidoreductase subunit E